MSYSLLWPPSEPTFSQTGSLGKSSKSYTLQSVDLLRQRIELETLDILTMVHHAIADRVDSHKKLRKGI